MQYRKKPVVIDAVQFNGQLTPELYDHLGDKKIFFGHTHLIINTLEGDMRADIGDYIIKGVKGEFYPCKPDIFELTYEPVN